MAMITHFTVFCVEIIAHIPCNHHR